jgi:hypothetical protein
VWILSTASSEVVTLALLIPGVDIVDCSGIANEVESERSGIEIERWEDGGQ